MALPSLPRDPLPHHAVGWALSQPASLGSPLAPWPLLHPDRTSGERKENHPTALKKKMLMEVEGPINLLEVFPCPRHNTEGSHSAETQLVLCLQFNLHQVSISVSPEDVL